MLGVVLGVQGLITVRIQVLGIELRVDLSSKPRRGMSQASGAGEGAWCTAVYSICIAVYSSVRAVPLLRC